MGSWGYKITDDDFVCDVIDDFKDIIKSNPNIKNATEVILKKYKSEIKDLDDGPLFWLGLAESQWIYDTVDPKVFNVVKDIIKKDKGLARWEEAGPKELLKRKNALKSFLVKISKENPKPKKIPKVVIRKPIYNNRLVAKELKYPFIPKSNADLLPGHFWQIPLSNGKFACGRVLQIGNNLGRYGGRSTILAGLIDWSGSRLPTSKTIAGCKLLEQGSAHIKCISYNGGQILGYRPLEVDDIEPMYELSHMPSNSCKLMKGLIELRKATLKEQKTLYSHSVWGLGVIKEDAEMYFVEKRKPKRQLPWDFHLELLEYVKSNR